MFEEQRPVNNSFYDAVIQEIMEFEKENTNNAGTTADNKDGNTESCKAALGTVCTDCDCSR